MCWCRSFFITAISRFSASSWACERPSDLRDLLIILIATSVEGSPRGWASFTVPYCPRPSCLTTTWSLMILLPSVSTSCRRLTLSEKNGAEVSDREPTRSSISRLSLRTTPGPFWSSVSVKIGMSCGGIPASLFSFSSTP